VAATAAIGLVVAWGAAGWLKPHLYAGTVLQQSDTAPPMDSLRYADGSAVDLSAYRGEVVLVYFGYTNCPDVCPTTLSAVAGALDRMGAEASDVELLMVSVDPVRDEPGELETYLDFFEPRFAGVSGEPADIERVASLYGVFYELRDGSPDTGYLVDHTASLLGIGPDGALRVAWPPGVGADALAADLDELLG
jgi:protein SCO1/2